MGLKRELGLWSTTAIAIGAMVGSGIFILPGIAFVLAGPSAVFAFVLAAVLVVPAALSIAEMATAMPEDGGPYLYVERSMGPMLGTIAGVGTWLMLSLKSALALVGGVPYLVVVAPTLAEFVTVLAVALALLFTTVNLVSAEGSGKLQFGIVAVLVAVLAWLVVSGVPAIDTQRTTGAFDPTTDGLLAATAIVFISYAGLTKIGAVAEEVKDPGRNLPLAILGALAFVTVLYALIVYVTIGVLDIPAAIEAGQLQSDGEGAIIALVAEQTIGGIGVIAIVIAAIMALASTANAGLLAASRFPLAMARDGVFPDRLESISERFSTPVNAVALTGTVLIVMVTVFPIQQVAAFGSAFQILVFVLLNVALIGFREGAIEEYDPAFISPLYPWLQLFGIGGGTLVLTQMGFVPFAGALGIAGLSLVWYYLYARPRVEPDSAAQSRVRQEIDGRGIERVRELFATDGSAGTYDVLVAVTDETTEGSYRDMVRIASDLGRIRSTSVSVVEFVDVPSHLSPGGPTGSYPSEPPEWLPNDPSEAPGWYPGRKADREVRLSGGGYGSERTERATTPDSTAPRADRSETTLDYREIDSTDHRRAMVDFATYEDVDLMLTERRGAERFRNLFGERETEWILEHAPCDVALVEDRGLEDVSEIAVASRGKGPYEPLKLLIADAIAGETGAEINLIRTIPADAPESRREDVERYHNELISVLTVPARSTVLETDDPVAGIARFVGDADLLVTGIDRSGVLGRLRGSQADQLVETVECTAIMVQPRQARKHTLLERLFLDRLF